MYFKKNALAALVSLLAIFQSGCEEPKRYHLLYPVEASKQQLLRLQGYRFLSSDLDSPASVLVLSNPIENGGFADISLSLTNKSKTTLHLSRDNLIVKMSKQGRLEVLSNEAYARSGLYHKPEGFDKLAPKMQAFGCAAANTQENITPEDFNPSQAWVWQRHQRYPFKDEKLYLNRLDIPSGETGGAIFRVRFPLLDKGFEQATVLIHLKTLEEQYRFTFILQSLQ